MQQRFTNQPGVAVHTGFPNPGIDSTLASLNLQELLIEHSASTYLMSIEGSEWEAIGIQSGDIAIIDRSLPAKPNDIVVWWRGSDFVLSKLYRVPKKVVIWGVVTATIHRYHTRVTYEHYTN